MEDEGGSTSAVVSDETGTSCAVVEVGAEADHARLCVVGQWGLVATTAADEAVIGRHVALCRHTASGR